MSLETTVDELKDRIENIQKNYYKGFVNTLVGISANIENYVSYPEDKDRKKRKDKAIELFSRVERYYSNIKFDELNSNKDFAPLFVIKELLPKFKEAMYKTIKTPNEQNEKEVFSLCQTIVNVGEVYRATFWNLIRDVRKLPGQENYFVKVTDDKKRDYYFADV